MKRRERDYLNNKKLYKANLKAVAVAYRTPPIKKGIARALKELDHAAIGGVIAVQGLLKAIKPLI